MAKIHYGKVAPTVVTSTTSQAGYGAVNLANSSLDMPWRATAAGAEDLIFTFAAATLVQTFHLHDVNFGAANVYKSGDGVVFNLVGALQAYCGKEGRRRGKITINDPAVKVVKVSIAPGAPLDGKAYWRAGAGYAFASVMTLASPFQVPYATRFTYPQTNTQLANKQRAVAATGTGFHEIDVPFEPQDTEDLQPAIEQARAGGAMLLDLDLPNYPWQVWPATLIEDVMSEQYNQPKVSDITLTFTEVV